MLENHSGRGQFIDVTTKQGWRYYGNYWDTNLDCGNYGGMQATIAEGTLNMKNIQRGGEK